MGDLLQISPQELKFRFELKKNIPVTMSLTNPGSERVAFKVKTTSPKKYCVRPSTGYVEPGATKEIQVIMQGQREYPGSLSDCKDKFLVQSLKVGSNVSDVSADLFEPGSGKEIKQSKLRVVMVGPPKPPSPVPEGVEEETSPPKTAFSPDEKETVRFSELKDTDPNSDVAKLTRERNRLRELLSKSETDKTNLTKRLEAIGQGGHVGGHKSIVEKGQQYSVVYVAFFALIAFIVGLLIGNRGS